MKLEITLPDWCDERDIFVLAGIELAAYKHANESTFKVKENRCVQCGECCTGHKPNIMPCIDWTGTCIHLVPDGPGRRICSLGPYRGYNCCTGEPRKDRRKETNCPITYIEA